MFISKHFVLSFIYCHADFHQHLCFVVLYFCCSLLNGPFFHWPLEKYAYMMESTYPEEFAQIKQFLPEVAPEVRVKIDEIVDINLDWQKEAEEKFCTSSNIAHSCATICAIKS